MPNATPGAILRNAKTPAFLVTHLTNVRYLSGMQLSSGAVLIESRRMTLFTDGRYTEIAERSAPKGMQVRESAALIDALRSLRRCGIESEEVTVARLAKLERKIKHTKFVHTTGVIGEFRRRKSEDELRCFRRAQRITREILRRIPSLLRRPITERELAWQIRVWAHELGAEDLAFDSIVAFGTNTSLPHHHPTDRVLKRGHIVQIDCGVRYRGYCADQSAVYFTGKPTPLQAKVFEAVCEAKDAAITAVHPGASTRELDAVARGVLEKFGFEEFFCHALGHGLGLDIHEGPTLSSKAPDLKLLKDEIITIEPGVYFPGRFGMRVEEEVIV